jgi:hypothetical protein
MSGQNGNESAAGPDGPAREPVKRYLVKPTFEGLLALSEAITGRKPTEEAKERLRKRMAERPFPAPKAAPEG